MKIVTLKVNTLIFNILKIHFDKVFQKNSRVFQKLKVQITVTFYWDTKQDES